MVKRRSNNLVEQKENTTYYPMPVMLNELNKFSFWIFKVVLEALSQVQTNQQTKKKYKKKIWYFIVCARQPNCFVAIAFKCTISIMHSFELESRTRTNVASATQHLASCSVRCLEMNLLPFQEQRLHFPFDLMCANNMALSLSLSLATTQNAPHSPHTPSHNICFVLDSTLCFFIRLHFIFIYLIHLYYLLTIKLICNMFCNNFQHSHEQHVRYCIRMHFLFFC